MIIIQLDLQLFKHFSPETVSPPLMMPRLVTRAYNHRILGRFIADDSITKLPIYQQNLDWTLTLSPHLLIC